jgi:hypothetical protein
LQQQQQRFFAIFMLDPRYGITFERIILVIIILL